MAHKTKHRAQSLRMKTRDAEPYLKGATVIIIYRIRVKVRNNKRMLPLVLLQVQERISQQAIELITRTRVNIVSVAVHFLAEMTGDRYLTNERKCESVV